MNMAPRWPQDGPERLQDSPKIAPRWRQDGPKMAPRGAKIAQKGPKMSPRDPKMAPTSPKTPPSQRSPPIHAPHGPHRGPLGYCASLARVLIHASVHGCVLQHDLPRAHQADVLSENGVVDAFVACRQPCARGGKCKKQMKEMWTAVLSICATSRSLISCICFTCCCVSFYALCRKMVPKPSP